MGSPNSTSESIILHNMLIDGTMPKWSTLRGTGIDVAHLERKFEILRPQLPYLGMYKPLREHFGALARQYVLPYLDKHEELASRECIRLFASRRHTSTGYLVEYRSSREHRERLVDAFLTKKGVWTIELDGRFVTTDSIRELHEILEEEVGEAFLGGSADSVSLAGKISYALDDLLLRRIEDRQRQLESMKKVHEQMTCLNERTVGGSSY